MEIKIIQGGKLEAECAKEATTTVNSITYRPRPGLKAAQPDVGAQPPSAAGVDDASAETGNDLSVSTFSTAPLRSRLQLAGVALRQNVAAGLRSLLLVPGTSAARAPKRGVRPWPFAAQLVAPVMRLPLGHA